MLSKLINYWFPNKTLNEFWFDKSKDTEIYELFYDLLSKTLFPEDLSIIDNNELLGYIILFDQISRNISRITTIDMNIYNKYSINITNYILSTNKDITYPLNKRIFILLPLRHSRITENLNIVIHKLNEYKSIEIFDQINQKIFNKFYLATLKDYTKVLDTIEIILGDSEYPKHNELIDDDKCNTYLDIPNNKKNIELHNNNLYKSVKRFIISNKIKKIGISLSGGVDSNVLMYILYQLQLDEILELVVAIHLNYNNRDVSDIEAENMINSCKYYNIPIITRKITHMKRSDGIFDRMFYEDETKKMRFELYKYAITKYEIDGVCLGHHKDDLSENVFMNILKGNDILDLFVMTNKSVINSVHILRPMLNHIKDDIYEIAHLNNIIYFKDTTPMWSMRGMIRNKIYPILNNFDSKIISGFHKIGKKSEEWKDIVDKQLIEPQLKKIIDGKLGFSIIFENGFEHLSKSYWSKLFTNIFHSRGTNMMTNKNIDSFVIWINNNYKKGNIFNCSNNYFIKYDISIFPINKLYFFKKQLIKSIIHDEEISLDHCDNKEIIKGLWKINISKTTEFIKKTITYDNLINGIYEYTEPIDSTNKIIISGNLHKNDLTRKLFKNFGILNKYIPKITSGSHKFVPFYYVKITFTFIY
jgi:tRNA(Ile)-lysidine synthetase-like protein